MILIIIASFCFYPLIAHNWIASPSRSTQANLARPPGPAKLSPLPHMQLQVGGSDGGQVEWATGHGDRGFFTYFALVHSADRDYLPLMVRSFFNEFLDKVPANAMNLAQDTRYSKYHRSNSAPPSTVLQQTLVDGDALYFERPAHFGAALGLHQYTAASLAGDHYYENSPVAEFPFVRSFWAFKINVGHAPGGLDVAKFHVPAGYPSGDYFLLYNWGGYYDIIDVNVINSVPPSVYGLEPVDGSGQLWARIDHCYFHNPINCAGKCQLVPTDGSIASCLRQCERSSTCQNVQVAPLASPSSIADFDPSFASFTEDHMFPWTCSGDRCLKSLYYDPVAPADRANTYLCAHPKPRPATTTAGEFTTTNDPAHPIFYSTCYVQQSARVFVGYEMAQSVPPFSPWRFYDKCIGCDTLAANAAETTIIPVWSFENQCFDCDLTDPFVLPASN